MEKKEDVLNKVEKLKKENKFEQAIKLLDEHKKKSYEKTIDHFYKKGIELMKKREYKEALKQFDKDLQYNENSFEATYAKALILYYIGKYPDSLEWYNKAEQIQCAEFLKLSEHGESLKKHKKFESAVMCLDEARRLDIDSIPWQFWHHKGLTLQKVAKYKEAEKCFDRALEINPKSNEVMESKLKMTLEKK